MRTPQNFPQPYGNLAEWAARVYPMMTRFFGDIRHGPWVCNDKFTTNRGRQRSITLITAATYTATEADDIIDVNRSGAVTITLKASPPTGTCYWISDSSGNASSNNITIASSETIRGTTTINTDGGGVRVYWNGTVYVSN